MRETSEVLPSSCSNINMRLGDGNHAKIKIALSAYSNQEGCLWQQTNSPQKQS